MGPLEAVRVDAFLQQAEVLLEALCRQRVVRQRQLRRMGGPHRIRFGGVVHSGFRFRL